MIKLEKTEVYGWEAAIRGMRNPLNSWDKSDSAALPAMGKCNGVRIGYIIGKNDHALMMKLCKAGTDHRKFMRQIMVSVDITAPLYWWKEFDTYKVGTTANSCSTMHTIADKEFTLDDFSHEHLISAALRLLSTTIANLNSTREVYLNFDEYKAQDRVDDELKERKDAWWQIIQLLPQSYNQRRTVTLNYEVLTNQYHARKNHKLDEWREYCQWVEGLPYSELITGEEK